MMPLFLALTVPTPGVLLTMCLLLAIVGFGVQMLQSAGIHPAFKGAIQFLAIIGCFAYVLHAFGVI